MRKCVSNILASNAIPIYSPQRYQRVGISIPNDDSETVNQWFDGQVRRSSHPGKWRRKYTGQEMLSYLEELSRDGPISHLTFAGHGWAYDPNNPMYGEGLPGVTDHSGFYRYDYNVAGGLSAVAYFKAATIDMLRQRIESRRIKFTRFPFIQIYACRINESFIQTLAYVTNGRVTAASGRCGAQNWRRAWRSRPTGFHTSTQGHQATNIGEYYIPDRF